MMSVAQCNEVLDCLANVMRDQIVRWRRKVLMSNTHAILGGVVGVHPRHLHAHSFIWFI